MPSLDPFSILKGTRLLISGTFLLQYHKGKLCDTGILQYSFLYTSVEPG